MRRSLIHTLMPAYHELSNRSLIIFPLIPHLLSHTPNRFVMSSSHESDDNDPLPASKEKKKRSRAVFTPAEKEYLLNAIETHPQKSALLTTSSTEEAIAGRETVWKDIQKQFAASGVAQHEWTWNQIALWFKNSRQRAKTMGHKHKAAVRRTGGGPKPKELPADISKIIDILGDSEKPMRNKNCSDAGYYEENEVLDPDEFSRKKSTSFSTPSTLMPATARSLFPQAKKVKLEAGIDYRKVEHELIVRKLQIEVRVLEKKEKLLDLKLSAASAGMKQSVAPTSVPFITQSPASLWEPTTPSTSFYPAADPTLSYANI